MSDFSYRIHPAIGIARVGNSEEFILAPETMAGLPVPSGLYKDKTVVGGLPIQPGTEHDYVTNNDLRDDNAALKRHAARFKIFQYPVEGSEVYPTGKGVEIQIGSAVEGRTVRDIIWTVHLANKKANTFVLVEDENKPQGISGYAPPNSLPPIRNWPTLSPDAKAVQPADKITVLNEPARVKRFTIDPGPRAVSGKNAQPVRFDKETPASYYDASQPGTVKILNNYPKSFPLDSFTSVGMDAPAGPIDTLGELRTDEFGRLLVTGGYGRAVSWKVNGVSASLAQDVNNDQWFDDASDGPVAAVIVFDDGSTTQVHGAWVTATDPSFAPQILNTVSLWDDIYDVWVRQLSLAPDIFNNKDYQQDYRPTFDDQVFPIFKAASLQQWTTNLNPNGRSAHNAVGNITADSDPASTPLSGILPIFRNPNENQFSDTSLMPLHLGDANQSFLALRKTQFFFLQQWDKGFGHFRKGSGPTLGGGELLDKATLVNCLGGRFSPGIDLTFVVRDPNLYVNNWQTSGGGPFRVHTKPLDYSAITEKHPFLTAGYIPNYVYQDGLEPGDLSKFMAIPWHTDYNSCATHPPSPNPKGNKTLFWSWPAQRPVAVFAASDLTLVTIDPDNPSEIDPDVPQPYVPHSSQSVLALGEQRWSVRGLGTESPEAQNWGRYQDIREILDNWYKIGTILQSSVILKSKPDKKDKQSSIIDNDEEIPIGSADWFLETESSLIEDNRVHVPPFPNFDESLPDARDLFYRLMSGSSPDVETLKQARAFTEASLKGAEELSNDPQRAPYDQLFFEYTEEAFQERLDFIYQELVDAADQSDPAADNLFRTRQDMILRTIQFAPFNLTDGSWLRNIGKTGPMDEVRALLSSISMDELGDGDVSKNHCNIYLDLCHSIGFYPYPVNSKEFAFDPRFLPSAFTVPAFELAISQFTDDYYPEILGMTVQLEWEVLDLKPSRDLLEYFGINPHFYEMHIGIDNAVNGHGQRAADAIKLYLENARAIGGEQAVQSEWRRIWNGFVAFGNLGSLGQDLRTLIQQQPTLEQQMLAMIERKAKYGSLNHQEHTVGATRINEWFMDPPGFLKALVEHDYIRPGDWRNSQMNQLLSFETGPMFRVFTEDEIQLWADYTNSLDTVTPAAPAPHPISSARAMAAVIDQLRPAQKGVTGHQTDQIADPAGQVHTIDWWFNQPNSDFMEALCLPSNNLVVPKDPASSRLITSLIAPTGPMGWVFDMNAEPPNSGTCRDIVVRWIKDGCPLLDKPAPAKPEKLLAAPKGLIKTLRLNSFASARDTHPTGKILGMGAIH